jgi:hypothetical protein
MKNHYVICTLLFGFVSQLPAQTITTQPTNQAVLAGGNVTFSVAVSGIAPFTYQWQFNGTNLPPSDIIMTVAGNGTSSFSGDSGAATNAGFSPIGIAMDASGNLLIVDSINNRIRKVGTNGIITTVVGGGIYYGDGGAATNAKLSGPFGVAVDASGDFFIADTSNNRIRKVTTNGIITTIAGNGTQSFSGDGGAGTSAALNSPCGIAVDAVGNLFIADTSNHRIRKVSINGIITTVAGIGNYSFSGDGGAATNAGFTPLAVAVDNVGNLFIADFGNNRIRKVSTNGIITTVAGNGSFFFSGDGGPAIDAALYYPVGVAVDAGGNLFIADSSNNRIRMVATNGIITTVAGNGTNSFSGDGGNAVDAALNYTYGVAVDASSGNLFIADGGNNRVRKVQINSPSLVLNKVSKADAGSYSVIITSSSGSVTSSVVALKVVSLNIITTPTILANGQFQFSFDTATGVNYAVQYSTDLTQWFPFVTLGGIGVPLTLIDPNTAGSQQRFYRFILSPQ